MFYQLSKLLHVRNGRDSLIYAICLERNRNVFRGLLLPNISTTEFPWKTFYFQRYDLKHVSIGYEPSSKCRRCIVFACLTRFVVEGKVIGKWWTSRVGSTN